jgi:hypothetical protein
MKSIARCVLSFHRVCAGITFLLGLTPSAQAHDPGLSTASVTVGDQNIDVLFGLARQDAAFLLPANTSAADIGTPEGFQAMQSKLQSVTADGFNLYLGEERIAPVQTTARLKDSNNVEILLRFRRTGATQLRLLSTFFERFAFGHREFLSVRATSGASLGETMLSAKKNTFQINLPEVAALRVPSQDVNLFFAFLKLGVEHILTGYDHLLFLFALMVVCRDLRSILTVITCFTIAHSITLGLATLDIVRLPGRIVEPLIAASIA